LSRKGLAELSNEQFRAQLAQQWQRILKKAMQAQTSGGNNAESATGNH
jgi:RNase P protein component